MSRSCCGRRLAIPTHRRPVQRTTRSCCRPRRSTIPPKRPTTRAIAAGHGPSTAASICCNRSSNRIPRSSSLAAAAIFQHQVDFGYRLDVSPNIWLGYVNEPRLGRMTRPLVRIRSNQLRGVRCRRRASPSPACPHCPSATSPSAAPSRPPADWPSMLSISRPTTRAKPRAGPTCSVWAYATRP